uniref:Bromodomain adjacent to zinc finger domain 2B n=1 Tax=Petromyzon marinus TaxID=7757 RepID=S4RSF4_PETMA
TDSDLETDSEGSDTEGKGAMDDTETDTEGERTPHNLSHSASGLTPTTSAALPSSSSSVLGATVSSPLAATSLGFHGYAVVARTPSSASAALLAGLSSPGTPHNAFTMVTPESMAKRRRTADERELRVPLDHGWRRETRIQTIGDRLHGEVLYYTPCGRKLRQYPEVNKFLTRNRITDINRQSFSFSAKMRVGDFYEAREGPQGMQWCLLGDAEIAMRIKAMEGRRGRPPNPERQRRRGTGRPRRRKGRPPNVERAEYARRAESLKLLKRLEAQAIARQAAEMKLMQKLEKQARLQAAKHARRQQAMQAAEVKRKQKEQMKMLKQQEKMQKIEQQRLEKEMRAQQILEAKRRRREEAANAKVMEAERRAQEKEMRRQHAVLLKHQERERRRQELLLFKALEAQKKAEERERLKQEKVQEKQLNKERKMEMRRLEMQIAMELKKPNEDMCLSEHKPMPDLPRMPGLVLPGSAFADCLMVVEFLRSFGKVLGLDVVREVPSIAALQEGLLNRGDTATSELLDLTMRLLRAVLRDPGLPHAFKDATVLGCRLRDMELTRETLSEVLRIFLEARSFSAALVSSFRTKAFLAHTPSQKASVLAFLCDELLCSRTVTSEIDKNIDHISSLRRDKWIVEGKLRTLRSKHSRRGGRRYSCVANVEEGEERQGSGAGAAATGRKRKRRSGTPSGGVAGESDDEDDEDDDDSDPEQDEEDEEDREEREERGKRRRNEHATDEEEKEMAASSNEFQKQMEKLNKQQNLYRRKLFEASHSLRALTFGQDRYRRRYWVLPHCGGLFVEAMESAEATSEESQEPPKSPAEDVQVENETTGMSEDAEEEHAEEQKEAKEEQSGNLFLQKPGSLSKFSELLEVAKMAPEMDTVSSGQASANGVNLADSSSSSSANNSPAHSRLSSPTPSTTTSQQGLKMEPMLSFSDFSTGVLFSADQLLKELSEKAKAGGRFYSSGRGASGSEETSATEGASRSSPVTTQSGQMLSMASLHSGLALNPFQLPASSTLAALQLKSGLPLLGLPLSGWPPTSLLGASLPFPSSLLGLGFSLPPSSTAQPVLLNPGLTLAESQASAEDSAQAGTSTTPQPEVQKQNDYSTPKPIPQDLRHGWWRVTDTDTIHSVLKALHPRGIREKALQKQLQKHLDYTCQACARHRDSACRDKGEKAECVLRREVASWSVEEQAFQVDLAVLRLVEELEERVASASMQVKGWRCPERASERKNLVYHNREPLPLAWCSSESRGKGGKATKSQAIRRSDDNPLDLATVRLAANSCIHYRGEEEIAPGLRDWRRALLCAQNASQVALCLQQLEKAIAWEKSIMKV